MDRNITAFLAVAKTLNLSLAADTIGLTQPALSKRLSNLEAELGTQLFERHRRGMRLTEAGQHFLHYAKRINQQYSQAHEQVGAVHEAGMGVLRVGAGPLFHQRFAARVFARLQREFPHLQLTFHADTNVRTVPMLLEQRLDIVLGPYPSTWVDDSIGFLPVTETEHGIVLRRDDPAVARPGEIDPKDLQNLAWVNYTENPESEESVARYYHLNGIPAPQMDVKTSSFIFGIRLVAEGGYVMTAPMQLGETVAREGLVIRAAKRGMPRFPVGVIYRKSSTGYRVIQRFLEEFAQLPDLRDLESYRAEALVEAH